MPEAERFPFTTIGSASGDAALMPYLPITLSIGKQAVKGSGSH